ncbi:coagulation factor 5/8 type domain protein [Paenibacillus campinasensis]|uniref:glucan endo-1,3-beta-D-glucosidase n=2 Tax=Paenibacillus TaxID=44249 RepID=A0ABW9T6D7_9BACL|nr:discoidin domain-containing protein [Paenibacillus campinasensis]MUG68452.1 coagulation factor 5/8 type domain protein [Paenibacillus campinasensis]
MYRQPTRRKHPLIILANVVIAFLLWIGSLPLAAPAVHAADRDPILSLHRPVYASSSLGGNTPDLAVDGNPNTRWESVWQKDPQWIYVDLGASANISKVTVNWENAYSSAYTIQVSDDEIEWTDVTDVIQGRAGEVESEVSAAGRYVRVYSTERAQQAYGISIWELTVYGTGGANKPPKPEAVNLALNKPVTVSSLEIDEPTRSAEDKARMEERNYAARNATDGDPGTRWSSVYTDTEWIYVDLGEVSEIGSVAFHWEAAYGRAYDIQVSNDAREWTTVYRELNGSGGKDVIPLYTQARYVKMAGIARGSANGYSLFEFEVRAYREGDPQPVYDIPEVKAPSAVPVGAGSYEINDITQLEPKNPKYRTPNIQAPIPSNGWWQSILIANLGDGNGLITLPLKNWYTKQGLAVLNPGAGYVSASGDNIDADGDPDLYLFVNNIHPAEMETKISGYGDYSASVILSDDDTAKMSTTFVKGSPFLYNTFENPDAVIIHSPVLSRLFDDNNNPVLVNDGDVLVTDHIGFEVVNQDRAPAPQTFVRSYGIYAPPGTTFMKLGNTVKIKLGQGDYLSIAALPSATELERYYQHAYAFVTDTRVDYRYDEDTSLVTTNFTSETELKRPGFSEETIMTLLPHQWKITTTPLTELSYPSIRGTLKVREGSTFTTEDRFYGMIPQFVEPSNPDYSRAQLVAYLDQLDADLANGLMIADPYWQGKKLHPLAVAVLISDQLGDTERRDRYLADLRTILTDWYTYSPDEPRHSHYFHYSTYWGSVFPYASGFGLNTGLTDHHFTYGYYVFASAVLATYDKEFLRDYGDMTEVLIRDYANPSRTDNLFPWFRNFDPYEGHSWAGGYADNRSGNNQEAAGEALFGWVGEYMWGLVTGNDAYRDAGIWGFTTEEKAAEQYWFNYDGDNWPEAYKHKVVGHVYGSAYLYGTFFSGDHEMVYGIHWLPSAEWMTYYGRQPEKAAALYQGLIDELGGQPENTWFHIIWPFQSLSDPEAVLAKWDTTHMQQNEAFNTYWFVNSMATLGHRSTAIWADYPAATVYEKDGVYTAQIWNPSESPRTIHFYNENGVVGSATVYPNALVAVDPTRHTTVEGPDPSQGVSYLDRTSWAITASASSEPVSNLTDNDLSTRWSSGQTQRAGEWLQVDLGSEQSFDTLFMNSGTSWGDYARGYEVYVSNDGENWGEAVFTGAGASPSLAVSLGAQRARFLKIMLTAPSDSWWSIAEIKLARFGEPGSQPPVQEPGTDKPEDLPGWTVTASSSADEERPSHMLDGDIHTRWTSGQPQAGGEWLEIDLGTAHTFDTVILDPGGSTDDYPRSYKVYVSEDSQSWGDAVASGAGEPGMLEMTLPPQTARYIRIVQTGESDKWWSVAELSVVYYGIGKQRQLTPADWVISASANSDLSQTGAMLDGDMFTRWTSGAEQKGGEWIMLDLGEATPLDKIVMDSGSSRDDYARGYEVYLSSDAENWSGPVASGEGKGPIITAVFPLQTARYVKIVQTGEDLHWWSISELGLFTADNDDHGSSDR